MTPWESTDTNSSLLTHSGTFQFPRHVKRYSYFYLHTTDDFYDDVWSGLGMFFGVSLLGLVAHVEVVLLWIRDWIDLILGNTKSTKERRSQSDNAQEKVNQTN